jgi:hypothetical protein
MNKTNFAKSVEKLIDPITVGSIHFIQPFNQLLPKPIQKKLMNSSSEKMPYMGFVVEPYSIFLCYEIADLAKAKSLLPDGFELIKTRIFNTDEPKYYAIFGCIRAHTSAFWGVRNEFYIIAEDKKTGLMSWIIVDYDTSTISYDDKHGLRSPNASQAVVTIDYDGTLFIDIQNNTIERKLIFSANIENTKMANLDQRLWLEGNLSIGYGPNLSDNGPKLFSLKFDPKDIERALRIPAENLIIETNSWYPGLFENTPSQIVCFPYSQHFISDSPGFASNLKNKEELIAATSEIDFDNIKVLSTKPFMSMIMVGTIFSFALTITLLLLWLLK